MKKWGVAAVFCTALTFAAFLGGASGAGSPSAPVGVTGIALDGQVELTWQAVTGAATYNVYRGSSQTTLTLLTSGVAGTTYDDATAPNGTTEFYSVRAVDAANAQSLDSLVVQATAQARACGTGNAVKLENCFPGAGGWKLVSSDPVSAGGIEGFATAASINKGGTLGLKINGAAGATIRAEIYRMGYYGSKGGRLISTIRAIPGVAQPACAVLPSTDGPLDCS